MALPPRSRRWHLHFTPTSSSWTNLIERWFKELTDRRLRRGVFTSVPELEAAIEPLSHRGTGRELIHADDACQWVVRRFSEKSRQSAWACHRSPGARPGEDVIPTDEMMRQHGAKPFRSVDDLPANDPFCSDEEYEAFLANLCTSRREIV